jgi:hypothetical protein
MDNEEGLAELLRALPSPAEAVRTGAIELPSAWPELHELVERARGARLSGSS